MMRVSILVYICVLLSCDQTHTANVKDSDEQSMLQEALLLVELLKSEYARVLRENNVIKNSEVDEKELQTCATTTVPPDVVTNIQTDKPMRHIEQSRTTDTLKPYTIHGIRRSYQPSYFPRRRFDNYRDYYGYYGPAKSWRRMEYENIFGPQPNQTLSTATTVSQSTTVSITNSTNDVTLSSVLNTTSTAVSEISTSSVLLNTSNSSTVLLSTAASPTPEPLTIPLTTLKPTEHSIPTISSSTTPPISFTSSSTTPSTTLLNKKQPTIISKSISAAVNNVENKNTQPKNYAVPEKVKLKHKKLFLPVDKTHLQMITSTNDPEQAQVAAELENELEAGIESSTSSPFSRRWPVSWRSSIRVHLAKSTPYHYPLPENHAFCYTNPRNSLCRTFIK